MKLFLIDAKMQRHWTGERPWARLWLPAPPLYSRISSYFKRQNVHSANLSIFVHSEKVQKFRCFILEWHNSGLRLLAEQVWHSVCVLGAWFLLNFWAP